MKSLADPDASAKTGFLGTFILAGGVLLAIRFHKETPPDPFRLQNRFVSELGWMARSPLARIFNGSLVVGSLLFAPVLHEMSSRCRTRLGLQAECFGSVSIAAAGAIGLCPMDRLERHLVASLVFFLTWPITITLYTLSFWRDKNNPHSQLMKAAGVIAIVPCVLLLACPKRSLFTAIRALLRGEPFPRPAIWWPAVFEWALIGAAWAWMLAATVVAGKSGNQQR